MNERIQELVGRAKFMAEETINSKISKNAELDAFAEKFAELIVKECVKLLITGEGNEKTSDAIWDLEKLGVDVGKLLDDIKVEK